MLKDSLNLRQKTRREPVDAFQLPSAELCPAASRDFLAANSREVTGSPGRARYPKVKMRRPSFGVFVFPVIFFLVASTGNDPSAGSPTETLLRLLLPLNDQVRASSRPTARPREGPAATNPRPSLNRSIGSSDGRCVQRAGT